MEFIACDVRTLTRSENMKKEAIDAVSDAMLGGQQRANRTQGSTMQKSAKYNAPTVKVDTANLQKAPKIDPSKLKKKTLKEELAEMGDPEKIRKDAEAIDADLLELLENKKGGDKKEVEKGKLTITHEAEGEGTEIIDKGNDDTLSLFGDEEGEEEEETPVKPVKGKKQVEKGLYRDELDNALEVFRGTELYPDALVILGRIQRASAARKRLDAERDDGLAIGSWNRNDLGAKKADEISPQAKEWDRLWKEEQMARADLEELQAKLFEITAASMRSGIVKALKPFVKKGVPAAMPEPDPEEVKEKQKEEAEKKADSSEDDDDAEKGLDGEEMDEEGEGTDEEEELAPLPEPPAPSKDDKFKMPPKSKKSPVADAASAQGDVSTLDAAKKNDAAPTSPKASEEVTKAKGKKPKSEPAC